VKPSKVKLIFIVKITVKENHVTDIFEDVSVTPATLISEFANELQ